MRKPFTQDLAHYHGLDDMKTLVGIMLMLLMSLQYELWFAPQGNVGGVHHLRQQVAAGADTVKSLQTRNQRLVAEISNLKKGTDALEERARNDLGMVREDEVFYQVLS